MGEIGLFGITVPEKFGGGGSDASPTLLVMEELSRGYASVADQCGLVELLGSLLAQHGTPEQQERYLRPLLRGREALRLRAHRAGPDPTSPASAPRRRATATAGC